MVDEQDIDIEREKALAELAALEMTVEEEEAIPPHLLRRWKRIGMLVGALAGLAVGALVLPLVLPSGLAALAAVAGCLAGAAIGNRVAQQALLAQRMKDQDIEKDKARRRKEKRPKEKEAAREKEPEKEKSAKREKPAYEPPPLRASQEAAFKEAASSLAAAYNQAAAMKPALSDKQPGSTMVNGVEVPDFVLEQIRMKYDPSTLTRDQLIRAVNSAHADGRVFDDAHAQFGFDDEIVAKSDHEGKGAEKKPRGTGFVAAYEEEKSKPSQNTTTV